MNVIKCFFGAHELVRIQHTKLGKWKVMRGYIDECVHCKKQFHEYIGR